MKEDKENAKPRRGEQAGLEEGDKPDKAKDKKEVLSKVVIRRLPPSLTKEQLEEHLQPLPDHDYFEFFANDSSLFPHLFARAYINFKSQEDIVLFRDRFDGYVFIDHRGQEYPAIVEFAPFQKVAKKKSKKKDSKIGTIDEDPEYKKFLESYSLEDEKPTCTPETLLEEIEARNKEMIAKKTTPLLSFLKNRQRLREEKREERRRRELERKRQREEERRKWKEDERRKRKDAEKQKKTPEKDPEKSSKDEPKIKLLKKPEKDDEPDTEKKFKSRKSEKEALLEERSSAGKRLDADAAEEKTKRGEEEYVKEYREKDYRDKDYRDKDYEHERRSRREKDKPQYEDDRRKPRDRYEKERCFRRRDEDYRKEREVVREKVRKEANESHTTDKSERQSREEKKEDAAKRDRIRNKDRPAMQLYQPGARSRSRLTQCDESPAKSSDHSSEKASESSDHQRKGE